ncbi:serine/threonine-protein kinase MARK2-like [Talpa occidentalis]|uniref:serine/threonine-protein kinase MARK2-like n=1 Tax=Talpa occidentalis TaxID=50954 RepID=UPI0023F656BE|nr:serine/threonine-protein kinase MARK2-like [Talpa occidentalis]
MRPSAQGMALRQYVMLRKLGEGAYAKVKLALHLPMGTEVAIKIVPKGGNRDKFLAREVACKKVLRHPNILKLFQVVDTEDEVLLVLEHAQGGDLEDYLCRLRAQRPVLRDGAAQDPLRQPGVRGPRALPSPGVQWPRGRRLEPGVVLYDVVTGELPFEGNSFGELRARVLSGIYHEPHYLSQQCRDLLRKMEMLDPQSRSTLYSIFKHPWVGLTNGLPPCPEPTPGQHKATMETMDHLGLGKEVINRVLLEARYDDVMGTYLMLLSRQRADEEGPEPAISPKRLSPDGAHCFLMPEDHLQPEVSVHETLKVGVLPKQDAQKPTTTSRTGIPQEDTGMRSSVPSSGPLMPDAWKPSMASRSGPVLQEAWGPNTISLPGPLQEEALRPSTTLPGPQLEGGKETSRKTSSPAPQPSSTTRTPPPRMVAPAETLGHEHNSHSTLHSFRGYKARARGLLNRILKCCLCCVPFGGKQQSTVHPAGD